MNFLGNNNKGKDRRKNNNTPAPTFRHNLWLRLPLKWPSIWRIPVATSLYGDKCTSTVNLGGHVDPRVSALVAVPQYSATQPDQRQHRLLHSSHRREPLCPFHSSAHGPQRSDKTACWCVAPNSMCHGQQCFSFCACHCRGWPVATLDWFSEQTKMLLHCCCKENGKRKTVGIHTPTALRVREWRPQIGCSSSTLTHHPSAKVMNVDLCHCSQTIGHRE